MHHESNNFYLRGGGATLGKFHAKRSTKDTLTEFRQQETPMDIHLFFPQFFFYQICNISKVLCLYYVGEENVALDDDHLYASNLT